MKPAMSRAVLALVASISLAQALPAQACIGCGGFTSLVEPANLSPIPPRSADGGTVRNRMRQPRTPRVAVQPAVQAPVAPKPVIAAPTRLPVAAPASVAQPSGSVQARIAAAWPGDDVKVLKVVSCESGFNPNIRSRTGKYWGLFQADPDFRAAYGYGPSVEQQTAMAWRGFQDRGWAPWSCA